MPALPLEKRDALGGDLEGDLEATARLAGDLDSERGTSCFLARGGDLEREGERERRSLPLAWGRGDLERPRVAFTLSFKVAAFPFFLDLRAGAEELDEEELLLLLLLEELLDEEEEELDEPLRLSLSLLLLDELELPELELPLLDDELEESLSELLLLLLLSSPLSSRIFCCSRSCACICSASSLGAFLRCSRRPSVRLPRPIEVKKLIAKRVLRALSVGNRPENTSCM